MVAASCAVARASPSRSIRAMSEASTLAGMRSVGSGPVSSHEYSCSSSTPDSITARVTSSTKSGTPSQRCVSSRMTSPGIDLPWATPKTTASTSALFEARYVDERHARRWPARSAGTPAAP